GRPSARDGRRGLPRRVAARLRHPDPPARRLRPRRGRAPGRLRRGAGAMAAGRRAGQSPGVARLGRTLQGDRPRPTARPLRRLAGDAGRGVDGDRRCGRRVGRRRDRGRPPAADLHLLPPGALAGGPRCAHAAGGLRPHHRGDRPRFPHRSRHPRPAHRPRQGEDPQRGDPVPGAAPGRAAGPLGHRAPGDLSRLHRRVLRLLRWIAHAARSLGGGDPPGAAPPRSAAGAGGGGSARVDAAARVAACGTDLPGRGPRPARGPGPDPLGSGPDRRGNGAGRARAPVREVRPVRAAGGDRGGSRRGAERRRDRLGSDRRPLRRPGAGRAVAGGCPQPRRRGRHARRPRGGPGPGRRHPGRWRPRRLPPGPLRAGGALPPPGPNGRSTHRLRARARSRAAGAGAPVPRAAAGRPAGL
ncbi:MAG: RNA polymerase ECF-type sigma factor, partial [uncultured Thermomicrobiales bacterium]